MTEPDNPTDPAAAEDDDTFVVKMTNASIRVKRSHYADLPGLQKRVATVRRIAAAVPTEAGEARDEAVAAFEKLLVLLGYALGVLAVL